MTSGNDRDTYLAILPSNSDIRKEYPENRPSKYTTKLQTPWLLSGAWEAQILDVSFPYNFYNIPDHHRVKFQFVNESDFEIHDHHCNIPPGFYKSVEEILEILCYEINQYAKSKNIAGEITYHVNKRTQRSYLVQNFGFLFLLYERVTFDFIAKRLGYGFLPEGEIENLSNGGGKLGELNNPALVKVYADNFKRRLRFMGDAREKTAILWRNTPLVAETEPDLPLFRHMYLYTDIIQNTNIGSTSAPVFGRCPVSNLTHRTGEQVEYSFPNDTWIPINKPVIETILIYLADETGLEYSFASGEVIVRLIVRRKPERNYKY